MIKRQISFNKNEKRSWRRAEKKLPCASSFYVDGRRENLEMHRTLFRSM